MTDWRARGSILRHCGKFRTGDRGNYSGYNNPQFDAALDRALLAVDAVCRDAYFDAQQILFEDVPALFSAPSGD